MTNRLHEIVDLLFYRPMVLPFCLANTIGMKYSLAAFN